MTAAHVVPSEIVARVIELFNAGNSARTIACAVYDTFGRPMSRNAVIGLVNRNKDRRARPPAAHALLGAATRRRKAEEARLAAEAPQTGMDPGARPAGLPNAVRELQGHQCKWPVNHPEQPTFHFCCAKRLLGRPYCATHEREARQPYIPHRLRTAA